MRPAEGASKPPNHMLLAVTSLVAGMELTITSKEARIAFGPALLLAGSVALYLVGDPLVRWAMPS